jgi:hypothetical protein
MRTNDKPWPRMPSNRRTVLVSALVALVLAIQVSALMAAVVLARFEAAAQADNTIRVEWETGSEINTVGFRLYRNETGAGGAWDGAIHTATAGNSPTGQTYAYIDAAVQAGVTYYYQLEDISVEGASTFHGPVSAGIGLPQNTGTPTRTPTATGVASVPTVGPGVQPTATRQFTNTPQPVPTATPQPGGLVVPPPASNLATPTRIGPAVVTTPTRLGGALLPFPQPTLAATTAPAPTVPGPSPTFPPAPTSLPTATVVMVAQVTATPGPSVTPLVQAGATPAVFEAVGTRPGTVPTAQTGSAANVAGRSLGSTVAIASAAIALAGLIAGLAFLAWRGRR